MRATLAATAAPSRPSRGSKNGPGYYRSKAGVTERKKPSRKVRARPGFNAQLLLLARAEVVSIRGRPDFDKSCACVSVAKQSRRSMSPSPDLRFGVLAF